MSESICFVGLRTKPAIRRYDYHLNDGVNGMLSTIRQLYHDVVPDEWRFWIYKLRNQGEIQSIRTTVYSSEKGNFSLRSYDKYNCIFVHITKTAGTSVAKSLFGELPYHYRAFEYRVIYGHKTFRNYFKFAFVRNPWDRLLSSFKYLKSGGWNEDDRRWAEHNLHNVDSFEYFVCHWLTPERLDAHIHFWPQYRFVTDRKGKLIIDYLGYLETINDDFEKIAKHLAISAQLKHENATNKTDYRTQYTQAMIQRVAELYAKDIEMFGYEFEGIRKRRILWGNQLLNSSNRI